MTTREFNEKYLEVKTNSKKHQGSTTFDHYEDNNGNKAGSYNDGYCRVLLYNGVEYVEQTKYNFNTGKTETIIIEKEKIFYFS